MSRRCRITAEDQPPSKILQGGKCALNEGGQWAELRVEWTVNTCISERLNQLPERLFHQ
jgi:hypothetical protein